MDVMAFDPCGVELVEVVGPQLAVGPLVLEDVIGDDQHAMGHRRQGFVLAPAAGDAVVLCVQVGAGGASNGLRDLPRTARNHGLPLVVLPSRRLPPLCLLPGQTPAQEVRCLCEGKRLASTPISATMAAAAVGPTPGIPSSKVSASAKGARACAISSCTLAINCSRLSICVRRQSSRTR